MNSDRWHTHSIELGSRTVLKRFLPDAADRWRREWAALLMLDEYAPGVAPKPLDHGQDRDGWYVRMSRVPGKPLRGQRLDGRRLKALTEAVDVLHGAIPPDVLADTPVRSAQQAGIVAQLST